MEKKEENYIRQLLLELDEYLFSLRWYDKEDREIMLKNIIGFDSIFQIIPKRFRKLLEGRIYTQQELDKAREEGRREVYEAIVFDENIPHDITTFVAANLWKNMRDKAKEELEVSMIFTGCKDIEAIKVLNLS